MINKLFRWIFKKELAAIDKAFLAVIEENIKLKKDIDELKWKVHVLELYKEDKKNGNPIKGK